MAEVTMSANAQRIMTRYKQNYVTDAQLERYLQLGVITEEEYAIIYATRHHADETEEQPIE